MLEPLDQSRVLAYLERLAQGRTMHLFNFKKAGDWAKVFERQALSARMAAAGIAWHPSGDHKKPSTITMACGIAQGTAAGLWACGGRTYRTAKWFEHYVLLGAKNVAFFTRSAVRTVEGFGNIVVEALAAGTPAVSIDYPSGLREMLSGGHFGHLVSVGDAQALAVGRAEFLAATHDHGALKARAQDFAIDKAVDQYEALLFPAGQLT